MKSKSTILCFALGMLAVNVLGFLIFNTSDGSKYPIVIHAIMLAWNVLAAMLIIWEVSTRPTDPWEIQRVLMKMSDQKIPGVPTLTNATLLYIALIAEEFAETIRAVVPALDEARHDVLTESKNEGQAWLLLHKNLNECAGSLEATSEAMKAAIPHIKVDYTLSDVVARPILDGTTDIAVVNCGFAMATGLPGAAAYEEVGRSNHSKANPKTGIIDKTPAGKWIKGTNFFEPDMQSVLDQANPWKP